MYHAQIGSTVTCFEPARKARHLTNSIANRALISGCAAVASLAASTRLELDRLAHLHHSQYPTAQQSVVVSTFRARPGDATSWIVDTLRDSPCHMRPGFPREATCTRPVSFLGFALISMQYLATVLYRARCVLRARGGPGKSTALHARTRVGFGAKQKNHN